MFTLCAVAGLPPAGASAAVHIKTVSTFGSLGTGAGQMLEPGGGQFGPNGDYYVVDKGNNRVDVFSATGAFKFTFGAGVNAEDDSDVCRAGERCQEGVSGTKAGELGRPEYLTVFEGFIYVTEARNNRVSAFSESGQFRFAFGKDVSIEGGDRCEASPGCRAGVAGSGWGEVDEPSGIVGTVGYLAVSDRKNNRVDAYDPEGEWLFAFGADVETREASYRCEHDCKAGEAGAAAGALTRPGALAAAGSTLESIFVADPVNNRVDVFRLPGEFKFAFGLGVGPGESEFCDEKTKCSKGADNYEAGALPLPSGVSVVSGSPDSAQIYVSDIEANRISKFAWKGDFVRAWGQGVLTGAHKMEVCVVTCNRGGFGTSDGAINTPDGVSVGPNGRIFVPETGGANGEQISRIQRSTASFACWRAK